jgi:ATP-dependent Clp protease ATP-binding subunit ClpA
LSEQDLAKIVTLKLGSVQKLLKDQGYMVDFSPSLISELGKRGFDPVLGARPLRRLIQDTIEAQLSKMILENKLVRGESFVADVNLLS